MTNSETATMIIDEMADAIQSCTNQFLHPEFCEIAAKAAFRIAEAHIKQSSPEPELDTLRAVEIIQKMLETIAKRPDLPNPERDADWKNCQKWSSRDAKEALHFLPTVRAALESTMKPVSGWQPIKTAPKEFNNGEGLILVCWENSAMYPVTSRWLKNAEAWSLPFNKPVAQPTHWMPLPKPYSSSPKQEQV